MLSIHLLQEWLLFFVCEFFTPFFTPPIVENGGQCLNNILLPPFTSQAALEDSHVFLALQNTQFLLYLHSFSPFAPSQYRSNEAEGQSIKGSLVGLLVFVGAFVVGRNVVGDWEGGIIGGLVGMVGDATQFAFSSQ